MVCLDSYLRSSTTSQLFPANSPTSSSSLPFQEMVTAESADSSPTISSCTCSAHSSSYPVLALQNCASGSTDSGLCAELCCNREKKDFQVESGLFWDIFWSRLGLFYRYLHQNAELLKITRTHDNPISRRGKVHQKTTSLSSKYT